MSNKKRLSKIIINTFIIFLITSVIACLFALLTTSFIDLVNKEDTVLIQETFKNNENVTPKLNILERTVNVLSTNHLLTFYQQII